MKVPSYGVSLAILANMKNLAVFLCSIGLLAIPGYSQDAKQDMKDAGHETKQAAKDTGHAVARTTRTTGRKIKHGTKRATHHMAEETEEGAAKVKAKTQ